MDPVEVKVGVAREKDVWHSCPVEFEDSLIREFVLHRLCFHPRHRLINSEQGLFDVSQKEVFVKLDELWSQV